MEVMKSKSGKVILFVDKTYTEDGAPISERVGVIRPKEGANLDNLIEKIEAGSLRYEFGEKETSGYHTMNYVPPTA